ncbi:MAG: hypothetical protein IT548_07560 [Alphaproteobacteria bacterium]|nr:hypothetical protein [Alphaproteobacteria bacterium]
MEFLTGALGPSFALYAGAAGLLAGLGLVRRAPVTGSAPDLVALWAPLGIGALATAFAMAAPSDIRLTAGALLLIGLAFMAAAPQRADVMPPGRRLGLLLVVASVAVALAGAFLSVPDAPNSPV